MALKVGRDRVPMDSEARSQVSYRGSATVVLDQLYDDSVIQTGLWLMKLLRLPTVGQPTSVSIGRRPPTQEELA